MTDCQLDTWIQEELERAFSEWFKGHYYKYDGAYYEVETGKFVCPCD